MTVTALVLMLMTMQAEVPKCAQESKRIFDDVPIISHCRAEGGALEYTIRAGPYRGDGTLNHLTLNFRGSVRSVKTPAGWSVQQKSVPGRAGTEIVWNRPSPTGRPRAQKESIVFVVAVSGFDAGFDCPESYQFEHKSGGLSGGENGCPIA